MRNDSQVLKKCNDEDTEKNRKRRGRGPWEIHEYGPGALPLVDVVWKFGEGIPDHVSFPPFDHSLNLRSLSQNNSRTGSNRYVSPPKPK
ncbi:hypothetical protein AVEN_216357-1 [Araneus ventricosus]|uniref:Uncharacterized protein n=1 Tax=Araneus ventricosus TaxID=182803 RepID=A0A4Y2GV16_ARAVE|nr:hypothetical protein AVEN_216357-1 [Araneus ventricosus]